MNRSDFECPNQKGCRDYGKGKWCAVTKNLRSLGNSAVGLHHSVDNVIKYNRADNDEAANNYREHAGGHIISMAVTLDNAPKDIAECAKEHGFNQ